MDYQQTAHEIAREHVTAERLPFKSREILGFDRSAAHATASARGLPQGVHRWLDMIVGVAA